MTESAEEKRKRRLINSLENYQWKYQYSIFPRLGGEDKGEDSAIASYALLEYDKELRRKLGEQFSDTAILFEFRRKVISWRFKTRYKIDFTQVYATFHTAKELDEEKLGKLIDLIYGEDVNYLSQPVTNETIEKNINKIKGQKLHEQITKEFEDQEDKRVRANRFSIINRKHLVARKGV